MYFSTIVTFAGFVNNADDNRIVTVVDNTGNAIRGESDFTFDGTVYPTGADLEKQKKFLMGDVEK